MGVVLTIPNIQYTIITVRAVINEYEYVSIAIHTNIEQCKIHP